MYRSFSKATRDKGLRGWRLELMNNQKYISKFDDRFNDDEYRFFINYDENNQKKPYISKMEKYKTNSDKIMKVKPNNEYVKIAESLLHYV